MLSEIRVTKTMTGRCLSAYFIAGATLLSAALLSPSPAAAQTKQAPGTASSASGLKQTAYLKASNPHANDHFGNGGALEGHGLALSGDGMTMAVGAPYESSGAKGINGNQNDTSLYASGAVYVFTQKNGAWTQQAYIKASNPGQSYRFGHHIVLSQDGNTMAVSSHFEASDAKGVNGNQNDKSIPQAGAVYVFTRSGNTWTQQAYIKASNTGEKERRINRMRAINSASPSLSAQTATTWRSAQSPKTARPRASTAIRATIHSNPPAPSTCSRAAEVRGRSKPT